MCYTIVWLVRKANKANHINQNIGTLSTQNIVRRRLTERHQMTRTTIRIAPQPTTEAPHRALFSIDFKGNVPEAEAETKARAIVRAQTLNHDDRGYLLNCLDIGNYTLTTTE